MYIYIYTYIYIYIWNFTVCTVCLISSVRLILEALRWAGHAARMEEGRNAFIILTGKPTETRPLGRSAYRWEDNITMYLNHSSAYDLISRHTVAVMYRDQ